MKTDAHMHSSFSYDAEVCPKKMIEASIQKGLKALGRLMKQRVSR